LPSGQVKAAYKAIFGFARAQMERKIDLILDRNSQLALVRPALRQSFPVR